MYEIQRSNYKIYLTMKKYLLSIAVISGALLLSTSAIAQEKEEKVAKEKEDKIKKEDKIVTKSGTEEIVIRRKDGGKDGKVTIEIKGDDVKVNGKSIDEFEDDNIVVRKRRTLRTTAPTPFRSPGGTWNFESDNVELFKVDENAAFLGVSTTESANGAKITNVTENSAAEKAGLKEGDVITKLNDTKVENHEDIVGVIRKLKPEDKVTITYKRDDKENKATTTLGKRKGAMAFQSPGGTFTMPHIEGLHGMEGFEPFHGELERTFSYGGRPRLGIKAQDTEDGKGVKVLDVAEESAAAKAGVKKGDIITEFDGKAVNSADALADAAHAAKDKAAFQVKVNRDGKSQTIDVKIPRKLKTANL